jgi:hypothetical protein
MSARTIELTQGYVATVDAEDYDRLIDGPKWQARIDYHADGGVRTVYAKRNVRRADGTWTTQRMHSALLPDASLVDHIDGDGLNNTRANLRPASGAENQRNASRRRDNTSGFKGVSWDKREGKWRAYIHADGRQRHAGHHADPQTAARAYDAAARELHGEYASLNFALPGERSALTGEIVPALAAAA